MRKNPLISVLIILVLVLILTGFGLNYYLNSDHIKNQLVSLAKNHLGRDIEVDAIGLSIYPNLGIKLENVMVGNPTAIASTEPFIRADTARVSVELIPLFRQQLHVKAIDLQKANIHLITQGNKNNWQFSEEAKSATQKIPVSTNDPKENWQIAIQDITVNDTNIYWQVDKKAPTILQITSLKTTDITTDKPVAVDFVSSLQAGVLSKPLDLNGRLTLKLISDAIQLSDIELNWDKSRITGHVNLAKKGEKQSIVGQLDGLLIEQVLAILGKKPVLSGSANLQFDLSTGGDNGLASWNGTSAFTVDKGIYHGVDLNFWWQNSLALLEHTTPSTSNVKETAFDTLSASFTIRQGIANSTDTTINTAQVHALGAGEINLPAETINYRVTLTAADHDKHAIPLLIQGPLASPNVSVDPKFLKDTAITQIKQVIEKKALDKIPLGKGVLENLLGH